MVLYRDHDRHFILLLIDKCTGDVRIKADQFFHKDHARDQMRHLLIDYAHLQNILIDDRQIVIHAIGFHLLDRKSFDVAQILLIKPRCLASFRNDIGIKKCLLLIWQIATIAEVHSHHLRQFFRTVVRHGKHISLIQAAQTQIQTDCLAIPVQILFLKHLVAQQIRYQNRKGFLAMLHLVCLLCDQENVRIKIFDLFHHMQDLHCHIFGKGHMSCCPV